MKTVVLLAVLLCLGASGARQSFLLVQPPAPGIYLSGTRPGQFPIYATKNLAVPVVFWILLATGPGVVYFSDTAGITNDFRYFYCRIAWTPTPGWKTYVYSAGSYGPIKKRDLGTNSTAFLSDLEAGTNKIWLTAHDDTGYESVPCPWVETVSKVARGQQCFFYSPSNHLQINRYP